MLSDVGRRLLRVPILCALSALGGCASMQEAIGIQHTGHQKDGTYIVSADEEQLACRQIKDRLSFLSLQLKSLPGRAAVEEQSRPATVGSALGRTFGAPGDGLQATKDFQRATAESDALNALLVKKQCT